MLPEKYKCLMKQQDIYLKDITRHIEGVIKAGDENNISTEINE